MGKLIAYKLQVGMSSWEIQTLQLGCSLVFINLSSFLEQTVFSHSYSVWPLSLKAQYSSFLRYQYGVTLGSFFILDSGRKKMYC